ncbi:hypothetical protein C8A01DRAFT_19788 [Parachaetomium inaequale]|uniref:Uncharacterized protein n=1 Tax=Parachaetomium inaequale TaxID=2588326 RepID=A0AAN6SMX7_9PEZI|nr:hypothetical protein C8A01DRAFT_19788 [Parachaetomium inaequale]
MAKGGKKVTEVTLNKKNMKEMRTYLDDAKAAQMSLPNWGVGKWQEAHGEGRSTSQWTFHIGFMYATDTGCYWTCIVVNSKEGNLPVKGTLVNWGTTAPEPHDVLEFYKNANFPLPDPGSEGPSASGSGGGAGGGGGSSSGGGGWQKQVQSDGNGGYYYLDANKQWISCDRGGNEIYYDAAHGYRHHIKAANPQQSSVSLAARPAATRPDPLRATRPAPAHPPSTRPDPTRAVSTRPAPAHPPSTRPDPTRAVSTRPDPSRAVSTRPALAQPAPALRAAPAHRAPALRPTATVSPGIRSNTSLNPQSNVRHRS